MKKIFTFLFAIAMFTTVFAQYGQRDRRDQKKYDNQKDVVLHDGGYKKENDHNRHNGRYYFTPRERDMLIGQINREYDHRINAVRRQFFMSRHQKMQQVRILENKRDYEIQGVFNKFNDRRNQFGDHGRRHKRNW